MQPMIFNPGFGAPVIVAATTETAEEVEGMDRTAVQGRLVALIKELVFKDGKQGEVFDFTAPSFDLWIWARKWWSRRHTNFRHLFGSQGAAHEEWLLAIVPELGREEFGKRVSDEESMGRAFTYFLLDPDTMGFIAYMKCELEKVLTQIGYGRDPVLVRM